MTRVRFTADDPAGAWKAGDLAEDLGWEQRLDGQPLPEDHPDFLPLRWLRLDSGEELTLTDPYERGLIAPLPPQCHPTT